MVTAVQDWIIRREHLIIGLYSSIVVELQRLYGSWLDKTLMYPISNKKFDLA